MVIQISFPLFLSNVTFDKKTHHSIRCVDYPVQRLAENSQVVSIRADCRRLVCTIPIKMIEKSIQIVEYVMGDGSTLGDSA